ncbi:MAG: hypothetical protein COW73_04640 [Nitrospirae bacterium CG18_big_fil_WC_8_21_14_2_50_70_55]|nr:hypothetical protein [Deltaproteobacteria bacterium]OIP62893.1 MAG: hypothetical protein AUK30_09370 [Nitrospirae bacterium CG2_30_70_394]PIQ05788.1 MAG: hypothetical protein COW73_04640 [Nitrospirae bacterium CG18_big_fil_WC_8_21_14_2_50_70_55]PIU78607.1 MAG: hypothetical protein COS73_06665 [Nitrospirae bacterium CG06_land_8_20_14_3_00_70_43]PIW82482.1 MAG: hypothetical protein COZ96_08490 [Nitrospirae bacterium CG_4_8_14_3_um_filter_70_85]PIX82444.1 MAG: hypothetical protein COZ33_10635 
MDGPKAVESRVAALEESRLAIRRLAHELNQPLTAVMGNAELLAMDTADPEMAASIERIVTETQRMAEIIQRLAAEARKGTGETAPYAA